MLNSHWLKISFLNLSVSRTVTQEPEKFQCSVHCFNSNKERTRTTLQCRSSPMDRGGPAPPPHFFIHKKKRKKCNFFCNFHVIQKSLDELICLEILPKV